MVRRCDGRNVGQQDGRTVGQKDGRITKVHRMVEG